MARKDKTDWGRVDNLTDDDIKKAVALDPDAAPLEAHGLKPARGRPKKANPKEQVSIRLSPDVLEHFKATGKGWQTRINEALQEWIKAHHA